MLLVGCNRNFNRGRAAGTTGIKFPRGETLHSKHGGNGSKGGSDAVFTMWHGTVYIRSFRFLGLRGRNNKDTYAGAITFDKQVGVFILLIIKKLRYYTAMAEGAYLNISFV